MLFKLQNSSTNKADVINTLQQELMDNEAYQKNLDAENLNLRNKLRELQAELENLQRLKDSAELFLKKRQEREANSYWTSF